MGYYASFGGSFLTKSIPENVKKQLEDICVFNTYETSKGLELCFGEYDKFYSDNWEAKGGFLDIITPFMISGSIEFVGEDDEHWCYEYHPDKHGFVFGHGRITYDFDKEVMVYE